MNKLILSEYLSCFRQNFSVLSSLSIVYSKKMLYKETKQQNKKTIIEMKDLEMYSYHV